MIRNDRCPEHQDELVFGCPGCWLILTARADVLADQLHEELVRVNDRNSEINEMAGKERWRIDPNYQ